jgi:hypothetical protein
MKRVVFIIFFYLLAIFIYARQVNANNDGVAYASPGDYIIRSDGKKIILNKGDIDYARKQLGLSTTKNSQNNQNRPIKINAPSVKMSPFTKFILIGIGIIFLVILIEWKIGKAIGKRLSKETGVVLGVILIFFGISIFIGIPIIIYSKGPKQYKVV